MNAAFAGPGACPFLCQISLWSTRAGRGARHDPNTMAGLSSHALRAESRASVVKSPFMRVVFLACDAAPLYAPLADSVFTPYVAVVASPCGAVQAVAHSRQALP